MGLRSIIDPIDTPDVIFKMMNFHEFSNFPFVGQITQIMKSADIGRKIMIGHWKYVF